MRVIKIGGNQIDQPGYMSRVGHTLANLDGSKVIVHGGGKSIDEVQRRLGSEPVKLEGLRRTDDEGLRVVLMVLCGLVSKLLVAALIGEGVKAVGLCGVDGGLIRVRKLERTEVDLGYVGEITSVDPGILLALLECGVTPVVAPISLGVDGQIYNVNADQVACAIASALGADELDFISDVDGIYQAGRLLPQLSMRQADQLIATEQIKGGMIPKVRAAQEALLNGVPIVRILALHGLAQSGGTGIGR